VAGTLELLVYKLHVRWQNREESRGDVVEDWADRDTNDRRTAFARDHGFMHVPTGYINQTLLASAVSQAVQKLGSDVVRVRHSVGADTDGDATIFFRIVLTDAASRKDALGDVISRIKKIMFDEMHFYENWGLTPYFSFRSQSEAVALDNPAWA
jgi:hypothetical protein